MPTCQSLMMVAVTVRSGKTVHSRTQIFRCSSASWSLSSSHLAASSCGHSHHQHTRPYTAPTLACWFCSGVLLGWTLLLALVLARVPPCCCSAPAAGSEPGSTSTRLSNLRFHLSVNKN